MIEHKPRVLLIDLENCPSQIHQLMNNLESYSQVIVCYAHSGVKIPIDWVMSLTAVINDNRLRLVKMPTVGKNSADFGIAFWSGALMAQLPPNTHFDIVSNDTDLDYVISLLTDQQRSAERVGIKKDNPPALERNVEYYLREYCLHLVSHSKPAKKTTLVNSIKAKFKSDDVDVNQLVEMMVKYGVIDLNTDKIVYHQQNLNKFSINPIK